MNPCAPNKISCPHWLLGAGFVRSSCAVLVALTLGCGTVPDETGPFEAAMRPYAESGEFSGAVLVKLKDRVLFRGHYGAASLELDVPFTTETRFRYHSLTKPLLSAAVLSAVANDKLSLDAPFCDYLDFCPESWRSASVRHLLSHRSGIPDFSNRLLDGWGGSLQTTFEELREGLEQIAPVSQPGMRWQYSNTGYVLLARVLERLDGAPIDEVMQRRVFAPCGMTGAGLEVSPPWDEAQFDASLAVRGMAAGYNGAPNRLQVAYSKMYMIPGAGAAYGTAEDLDAFARTLFEGDLLPAGLRQAAVQVEPDADTPYALGWVVRERHDERVYRHDGGNNGFLASLEYYPGRGLTVIVLSNLGFAPIEEIRAKLGELGLAS